MFHQPIPAAHVAAFHLFTEGETALVLRVRHRVMDAKGAQWVLRCLFAHLRQAPLLGGADFPADEALRRQLAPAAAASRRGFRLQWPGMPLAQKPGAYQTAVIPLPAQLDAPLAKAAAWLARHWGEPGRFLVPVDLRRHPGVAEAAANLSLPIYLTVSPTQSWQEVQGDLLTALAAQAELARDPWAQGGRYLPPAWLRALLSSTLTRAQAKGRYPMSGFLSHNGRLALSELSTSGFIATDLVSLPVFVPLAPCCLVLMQHDRGSNLALAVPTGVDLPALTQGLLAAWQEAPALPRSADASLAGASLLPALRLAWADTLALDAAAVDPEATFLDLGGDSLQLLTMLSGIADAQLPQGGTAFIQAALATGGQVSLRQLAALVAHHSPLANPR
jgi:hypothetical protein